MTKGESAVLKLEEIVKKFGDFSCTFDQISIHGSRTHMRTYKYTRECLTNPTNKFGEENKYLSEFNRCLHTGAKLHEIRRCTTAQRLIYTCLTRSISRLSIHPLNFLGCFQCTVRSSAALKNRFFVLDSRSEVNLRSSSYKTSF